MRTGWTTTLILGLTAAFSVAQDDVKDIPSQDLRIGKDDNKRYFLIGPRTGEKAPKEGHGLVIVLPGGSGSADFHPFIKRIYKESIPEGYLVAQPVAVRWTDRQEIVWPTKKNPVEKMKFTTEEFVEAVIADVRGKHRLDAKRVFTLSWSSSGPAAYAVSLSDRGVKGSLIAMSVFNPKYLPPLEKAKGHVYYLYHSPDDRVCPYRMAQQAERDLEKHGAKVKLETYRGGHGWKAGFYGHLRTGIKMLEEAGATNGAKP